jgi:hypothetical protein
MMCPVKGWRRPLNQRFMAVIKEIVSRSQCSSLVMGLRKFLSVSRAPTSIKPMIQAALRSAQRYGGGCPCGVCVMLPPVVEKRLTLRDLRRRVAL